MKRLIEMFLPKKAVSLDGFVDLVLSHQCLSVEVAPINTMMVNTRLTKTGMFDLFSSAPKKEGGCIGTVYYVCCIALTPRRKKIVYQHSCIVRYVPHHKHADDHKQHELEILGEARWLHVMLKQRLNNTVEVRLHEEAYHHPSIKRHGGVPLVVKHP